MNAATYEVILAGAHDVQEAVRIESHSTLAAFDTAIVILDNASGELPTVVEGDTCDIALGYAHDINWPVFTGRVTRVERGRELRLELADPAQTLATGRVVRAWRNTTPDDVARDLAAAAGLTLTLPSGTRPRRAHWVASGQTPAAVLGDVGRAWGLDWVLFYDAPTATMWWGPWDQSPVALRATTPPLFNAPRDFTAHQPAPIGGRGTATMLARPWLAHSQTVVIVDEAFGAAGCVCRLDRVVHVLELEAHGRPAYRTDIEYRRLA